LVTVLDRFDAGYFVSYKLIRESFQVRIRKEGGIPAIAGRGLDDGHGVNQRRKRRSRRRRIFLKGWNRRDSKMMQVVWATAG